MAEVTNYIDRLVAELCPDGVEYRPLGEIVKIKNGKGYKDFLPGNIPVYGSGGVMTYVDTFAYDKPTVLIPRKGSLGNLFYLEEPFWNVDTIFYTEIDESCVIPKYLFYVLKSAELEKLNTAGGVPSLTQKVLNKVLIPVPPLEIQEAIVEILDKFTNLEAELEAELEARTLQYEYYRDSLFEALDCPRVPLGSFARLVRGSGMPKTDFSESGVGAIHYGQIYTKFGTATAEVIAHVPEEKAKKLAVVNPGDVIVANTSENLEDVCKAVAWVGESDIVTGGHATVIKAPEQNAKFISYYMATGQFNKDKRRHAFGTKVIDVAPKNLAKIEFPLPSPEEQQRIVDILDRFDALTSSLSEGLPAELAARRSQYEYYRDQLLTFPRKGENQ